MVARPQADFSSWWHRYVCCDDTVAKEAVAFPTPAAPGQFAVAPLEAVARAVASAMGCSVEDIRRRGRPRDVFLGVAPRVGWDQTARLAAFCGVTQRAVQKASPRLEPSELAAALLCLGDERLRA